VSHCRVLEFGIGTGRWNKPTAVPLNERTYITCIYYLEDEFHFLLKCPLYYKLRKIYIKPYHLKTLNMPKCIEPMATENVTEIRN